MTFNRSKADILYNGKRFAIPGNSPEVKQENLKAAARLYANADIRLRYSLLWWWVEGVRDYAEGNEQVAEWTQLLKDESTKHIVEGRY